MSRLGTAATIAVTLGLLVSCGGSDTTAAGAAGSFHPGRPGVLKVATAQLPAAGFWEGTEASPTGGFEWGLAQALAKRFGLTTVKVVEVPFERLVSGELDDADLALSQLTGTEGREKVLDFSEPYLPAQPAILTRAGTKVADVAGARTQRWTVRRRSTLETFLAKKVRPNKPTQAFDTRQESIDALTSGAADAVLLDLPVASAIASRSGGRLRVAAQFPTEDNLSVALPDHSPNREAIDSAIRALRTDGTLRDLADRWLKVSITGRLAEDIPLIAIPS